MSFDIKKEFKEIREILSQKADKADFEGFATKSDLNIVEYNLSSEISWIKENMFTRDDFMQYMTLFDEIATEVKDARREQLLFASRFVDLDDKVHGHEKRIKVLEAS